MIGIAEHPPAGDAAVDPPASSRHPLHVLDQYLLAEGIYQSSGNSKERQDEILRVADVLFGTTLDGAITVLEQNCDHSNSCMSLNLTMIKSKHRSLYTVKGKSADTAYMCLLPNAENNMYYCSCRSYLERSKSGNICKHLLAIKLMPVLAMTCTVIELPSEEDFSRVVLQKLRLS